MAEATEIILIEDSEEEKSRYSYCGSPFFSWYILHLPWFIQRSISEDEAVIGIPFQITLTARYACRRPPSPPACPVATYFVFSALR